MSSAAQTFTVSSRPVINGFVMKKADTMTATPIRYAPAGFFSLIMDFSPS